MENTDLFTKSWKQHTKLRTHSRVKIENRKTTQLTSNKFPRCLGVNCTSKTMFSGVKTLVTWAWQPEFLPQFKEAGETQFMKVVPWILRTYHGMCVPTHALHSARVCTHVHTHSVYTGTSSLSSNKKIFKGVNKKIERLINGLVPVV